MYCQFCGYQIGAGVNYCKQCGAVVRSSTSLSKGQSFPNTTGIALAIAGLGVGGPAVVFGTAIPLLAANFGIAVMAMLFGFLVISVGLGALIRQMHKITSHAIQNSDREVILATPTHPQYIDARAGGMPSITENTTRSFGNAEPPLPSDQFAAK